MKFGNQARKKLAAEYRAERDTLIEKKRLDNQYENYLKKREARLRVKKTQGLDNLVYEQQRGSSVLGKFKENAKKNREQKEMEKRSAEELAQREIINILDTAAYDRQQQRGGSVLGKFKENTQKKREQQKELEQIEKRKELEQIEKRKELEQIEKRKELEEKERKELEEKERKELEEKERKELEEKELEQIEKGKELEQREIEKRKEREQREMEKRKEREQREMEKRKELEQREMEKRKEQPIHYFLPITEQTILPRRVKRRVNRLTQLNADIKYLSML